MKPTQAQLDRINALTLESQYTEDQVEVFRAMVADDKLTTHKTKFGIDLRHMFARDMASGKTVLNVLHADTVVLPVGRAIDGVLQADGKVYGTFFIPKDVESQSVYGGVFNTNALIEGIKTGLYKSTSVGFANIHNDDYVCSICNHSLFSDACTHYPGRTYDGEECYVEIRNTKGTGVLLENSIVSQGAVLDAGFVATQYSANETPDKLSLKNSFSRCTVGSIELDGEFSNSSEGEDDMSLKVALDRIEELTKNLAALEEKIRVAEEALATYKAEAESQGALVSKYTTELKEMDEKVEKAGSAMSVLTGLVQEYGLKATGENVDLAGTPEELAAVLKNHVDHFIETFSPERQIPATGNKNAASVEVPKPTMPLVCVKQR